MISRSVDLLLCTRETSSLSTVRPDLVILVIMILIISFKFTIFLEINRLDWESEKIQGLENPTEFVPLGVSRMVTKGSFTFTVK